MMQENQLLLNHFSQNDPEQLKKVIEMLIARSRMLLGSLQEIHDKIQQVETEKQFWKDSYFNLKEACHHYVQRQGLAPFTYIASLEDQLKKDKVYKSCLEEKFKVMVPNARSIQKRMTHQTESLIHSSQKGSISRNYGKQMSSTFSKETPERTKNNTRHKIGPKSIEFFKFGQQKNTQMLTKR